MRNRTAPEIPTGFFFCVRLFVRLRIIPIFVLLASCARYAAHDPKSYCMERVAEWRLRPATDCENPTNSIKPECDWAMTLELHWKCKRWSSW